MSDFIKAATSPVPSDRSQAEIITVLTRYGASGFGFRRRADVVEVTFHLPRTGGDEQSVRIPVNIKTVHDKLLVWHKSPARTSHTRTPDRDQAERTAWRALLTWIEASLLAVQLGAQSLEEAFFANLLVTTDDGHEGRLVDYVATLGTAAGGTLPSPRRLLLNSGE
jgi:hypothetical protein